MHYCFVHAPIGLQETRTALVSLLLELSEWGALVAELKHVMRTSGKGVEITNELKVAWHPSSTAPLGALHLAFLDGRHRHSTP